VHFGLFLQGFCQWRVVECRYISEAIKFHKVHFRESFADLPCWILCAKLFLHDFEYQQRYEADEEVRLDALRERRRWQPPFRQRQETDKSTATRSRLQLTPDNVGGQAIVRHAPRERRRWQPPFRQRQGTGKSTATRSRLQLTPDNVGGTSDSATCAA